jgi:hypothetical protein
MKKRMSLVTVVFAVAAMVGMAMPAAAANLHHAHDDGVYSCKYGGTWHFVNNQTGGVTDGKLYVDWGKGFVLADDDKDNPNSRVLHWWVTSYGDSTLVDAYTVDFQGNPIPGKLVLSDHECNCACACN